MYIRDINPGRHGPLISKIPFLINYFEKEMQINQPGSIYGAQGGYNKSHPQSIVIKRNLIEKETYKYFGQNFWEDQQEKMNTVFIDHNLKIEDQDESLIVDFANAYIGGGTLGKGAAQEEILFLIFPQAIISMLICEKMDINEAILIQNVRRYANYSGYSSTLQYHDMNSFHKNVIRKDIIAMDAIQYYDGRNYSQYRSENFIQELNKCYIAFRCIEQCRLSKISSGRWGCGAFKGDPQLKFLLQWIAASLVKKHLIFATINDNRGLEKLNEVIMALSRKQIKDVFGYLVKYSQGNQGQHDLFNTILWMANQTKLNDPYSNKLNDPYSDKLNSYSQIKYEKISNFDQRLSAHDQSSKIIQINKRSQTIGQNGKNNGLAFGQNNKQNSNNYEQQVNYDFKVLNAQNKQKNEQDNWRYDQNNSKGIGTMLSPIRQTRGNTKKQN
ncbi:poly adp-ribose [Stylonychia lemnae]|uniref:Poly adp-ribose n=1 Tax=Stylonychia lemnae TaxID=5949 RepID=A0A078BAY4_STYLE|nr:poly adp-ribose [Stylonychia lemnae]|eukprot:CDW91549.1 poly adp-ribose [Stylonychia lemnae]